MDILLKYLYIQTTQRYVIGCMNKRRKTIELVLGTNLTTLWSHKFSAWFFSA